MDIEFKPVTADNFQECIALRVKNEQMGFIASNLYSIAEAYVETFAIPLCVYADEQMVGLILYGPENFRDGMRMWIDRFMIDGRYQGKGYGKAALAKLIETIREKFDYKEVYLSYEPENAAAEKLYGSFGFIKTGEIVDGECLAVLSL